MVKTQNSKRVPGFRFQVLELFRVWNSGFGISRRSGFTLIETVVALILIVAAITGPFTLAVRGVLSARLSRNKLIALNLVQEGIEIIRQKRENNKSWGRDWRYGFAGDGTRMYQPDVYSGETLTEISSPVPLRFNPSAGYTDSSTLYNQNPSYGSPTPYTRVVTITKLSDSQILVKSEVAWTDLGTSRKVELQETFYDWN